MAERPSRDGLLSHRGLAAAGQAISELMAHALENPHLISLAAGFVDNDSLPTQLVAGHLEALLSDPEAARQALQYGTTQGLPELREALCRQLLEEDGGHPQPLSPDQFVITAGSNQLLFLVSDVLLDPGDVAICAAPTYLVYLGILKNLGASAWGVTADRWGICPAALEQTLQTAEQQGWLDRIKILYLVPYFDNPRGTTMPAERCREVMDLVARWSRKQPFYVIADNAYRHLRYAGDDVPSLRHWDETGERVITAGTFSKPFSPGVRVGWGALPRALVRPVSDLKGNLDFGSPNLNQHLVARILRDGSFAAQVERLRAAYRIKMQAMQEAAEQYLAPLGVRWTEPHGGLYLWAELPETLDTGPRGPLLEAALEEGVMYVPGEYCFPADGTPIQHHTMRLSFGVQSPAMIARGIEALGKAIQRVACAAQGGAG